MMRLSGSVKFFWAFASGSAEGGAAFGPDFLRPSASRFSAASASALSLASAAAFASASNSALASRILSARRFLSAIQSGISSPVLSPICPGDPQIPGIPGDAQRPGAATPTTGAAIRPERSDRQSVVAPQDSPTGQQQ